MGTSNADEYLEAARSEDLKISEVKKLAVVTEFERQILDSLEGAGAHLLQGARGVGKTTLLRFVEIELDARFDVERRLPVYVNFKTSTLLEGISAGEKNAFQIWVNTKILQALHEKLVSLKLLHSEELTDPYKRVFGISSVKQTESLLTEKLHLLQQLAFTKDGAGLISKLGEDFLARVYDPSYLREVIREVTKQFKLDRVIFLFDEAAHTFIPEQQEIFFEIFKLLHGGTVACKAAVYPTVTSYGRNFEIGQDAIVLSMDRFEPAGAGKKLYREQFREIIKKRLPVTSKKRKDIFSHGEILDLCIDVSSGNPRGFLHILTAALTQGFSERALQLAIQEYVDRELLPYHQNLAKRLPKYAAHVRVGLELLRGYVIPEIRKKNRRETKSSYQSAFFTISRDISPNLKLALDILCYSGILISKGTVKIAGQKTGHRYMVHLALLANERAFGGTRLKDAVSSISLTDYREFSSTDPNLESYLKELKASENVCSKCSAQIDVTAKFCSQCGTPTTVRSIIAGLLDEPVASLSLSDRIVARVQALFPKVGDVVQASREDVMEIPYIKDVRSRIVKNAADEFISG